MNTFLNIENVLYITSAIIFIGQLIATLELGHLALRNDFSDKGYFSWKILALDNVFFVNRNVNHKVNIMFGSRGVTVFVIMKLCALLILLVVGHKSILFTPLLMIVVLTSVFFQIRFQYGGEGSDQMSIIVIISLLLGINNFAPESSKQYAIYFIALQSILSYTSAGIAKLLSKKWRSGEAVFDIFNTGSYGSKFMCILLKKVPKSSFVLSWIIILFESLFPLVLIGNETVFITILVLGFSFHLLNAFIMGLNSFLFTFAATYPCILFLVYKIMHQSLLP